jgi:chitin disaccharide deacetylase
LNAEQHRRKSNPNPLNTRKRLVVNADDFGFTPDVNGGIVEAHRRGILTAATLMANGAAFDDAARLARQVPSLDAGCHLVLIGGRSLLHPNRPLPHTIPRLLAAIASREIRIYDELAAQVRRLFAAGIRPTHLDTHKHTHLAPPVLDAVARLSQEFGIVWVRRPFDLPLNMLRGVTPRAQQLTSGALGLLRGRFQRALEKRHCRTTDYFAGFQMTGRLRTQELVELLGAIPTGITELMCHPGRCGPALRNANTRLKESRERELEALTAPETRRAVEENGIELVGFGSLT